MGRRWTDPNSISTSPHPKVNRVENANDRYNGWMAFMASALVATNYTENGWGLARAPAHITSALQDRFRASLVDDEGKKASSPQFGKRSPGSVEHFVNVIGGDEDARPVMIFGGKGKGKGKDKDKGGMTNNEILEEMKPMFEWWTGMELKGSIAYGIRAYRNNSNLLMHVDKSSTHVIR